MVGPHFSPYVPLQCAVLRKEILWTGAYCAPVVPRGGTAAQFCKAVVCHVLQAVMRTKKDNAYVNSARKENTAIAAPHLVCTMQPIVLLERLHRKHILVECQLGHALVLLVVQYQAASTTMNLEKPVVKIVKLESILGQAILMVLHAQNVELESMERKWDPLITITPVNPALLGNTTV